MPRTPMTANELRGYGRRLRELAARLSGGMEALEGEALRSTGTETAGGASDAAPDRGDVAAQAGEVDLARAALATEGHILAEVNAALARIERGTFGRCEACGKPVGHARLEALPYARHCVRCAAEAS